MDPQTKLDGGRQHYMQVNLIPSFIFFLPFYLVSMSKSLVIVFLDAKKDLGGGILQKQGTSETATGYSELLNLILYLIQAGATSFGNSFTGY